MRFTIEDLEENCSYRLRLRTVVELEPLRLLFAEFAEEDTLVEQEDQDTSEPNPEPGPSGEGAEQDEQGRGRRPRRAAVPPKRLSGGGEKLETVSEGGRDDAEAPSGSGEVDEEEKQEGDQAGAKESGAACAGE